MLPSRGAGPPLRVMYKLIQKAKAIIEAAPVAVYTPEAVEYPETPLPKFLPPTIKRWVMSTPHRQTVYEVPILRYTVRFVVPYRDDSTTRSLIEQMSIWAAVCALCAPRLEIPGVTFLWFPHDAPKRLPASSTTVFGPEHVNSGYCTGGTKNEPAEIVVFRREEALKVYLHECIHAWQLDAGIDQSVVARTAMEQLFPYIEAPSLQEGYTEAWARIGLCALLSSQCSTNERQWMKEVKRRLQIEQRYGAIQINRLLGFLGLSIQDLRESQGSVFRETTNACSYYVLAGILVFEYPKFLTWCSQSGSSLLKAEPTPRSLVDLISNIISPGVDSVATYAQTLRPKRGRSLRMCSQDMKLNLSPLR